MAPEAPVLVGAVASPARSVHKGRFVSLHPADPKSDIDDLFAAAAGDPERDLIWTYMPSGPFRDREMMARWLEDCAASLDPLYFAVAENATARRVGVVSFLNIVQAMRTLELGNIWYGLAAQRTNVNTESVYLMLCEAFDNLGYRRVEWKCDALNERSRRAALRLGFRPEGIFRQHMIIKGRNRDTAWFAMLDRDWAGVKRNLESWLYSGVENPYSLGVEHRS